MPNFGSIRGRLLRIDLTTRTSRTEEIPASYAAHYLGGRGLGAALLAQELRPEVDPLGPENVLIFSTGPLAGTAAPGSSKWVVTTKSPLTGIYLMSISSRGLALQIKKAGYDAVVIQGVASEPVYLLIQDAQVSFKSASALIGLSTSETQRRIMARISSADASIACIGPAGENKIPYACIINDGLRSAGRGGAGAVMGSKNLKAVAVCGSEPVELFARKDFLASLKECNRKITESPLLEKWRRYGTTMTTFSTVPLGIMPGRNWTSNVNPEWEQINGEAARKMTVGATGCRPCPLRCSLVLESEKGSYAGRTAEGPEYETLYAFGSACGIYDLNPVIHANALCDDYGMDTISAGVSLAFAMECFERGFLKRSDTDNLDVRFGAQELIPILIPAMARREGFGDLLAQGTRKMALHIGQGSDYFAMHAKGMELGGYDPRGAKSMALVYACGARGGCHHAGGRPVVEEVNHYDRFAERGKALLTKNSRDFRVVLDSAVMCAFMPLELEQIVPLINHATGLNLDTASALKLGERISNVEKLINSREGLKRADDTLPLRLLSDSVPYCGNEMLGPVQDLSGMLDEFYEVCAWDLETGAPKSART